MPVSSAALHLLDSIEAIEMRSLEWGFADGSLSEQEALDLETDEERAQNLLEELIEAKLVVEVRSGSGDIRIRSRFAEMMRLLAANRQLFANKPWQNGPQLVADYRVDRRPRRFPRRQRLPADVIAAHQDTLGATALRRALWAALTARPEMKLADFQERASVRLSKSTPDGGTVVTAGTGSGKTIAFYLPGMIRIGEAIGPDSWVKAIAIYPRTELLKDQFGEAYRMARTIDGALSAHGKRPVRIGALFSATPNGPSSRELDDKKWTRRGDDFVCPWIRCPTCDDELLWRQADIAAKLERLTCGRPGCGLVVTPDQIVLTRGRLQRDPPDILFTTTEILNQRMSDHWTRGLFGIGRSNSTKPFLALLDEVHTYIGPSGAQAALTLRRWRYLLQNPVSWVGLSATLGDAAAFFANLTGVNSEHVEEITPAADEYEEQGAEYQILLRGDPTSRASLASTTIQTSMLLPRFLDPPGMANVSGAFGRRVFLFTDDLDVTNRLFDGLRDAEAYNIFGRPDPLRQPLANLRAMGADAAARDQVGQRWRICETLGHPLDRRLVIGRTTSQDAGVNRQANIIVATAALEVGFNDTQVGAVIQHKAPRGMASFLQRKGRSGRDRNMRPITLTVLSDYGRDRAFYQAYEHLFDPTLEPQHLPTRNPYVLKMQAVFALFDWLAARTAGYEKAWQWDLLSRPNAQPTREVAVVSTATKALLRKLVEGDVATINDLRSYLTGALGISAATAESLLWEAPRSLLLEAVPTLVRRFFLQWRLAFPSATDALDLQVDHHPLPDFVPRNLFSDLSLPEVRIVVPPATRNLDEKIETLPVLQALNQLAPGRVSRRFAHERGELSHWMPVDPSLPQQNRRISDYAERYEFVGEFISRLNGARDQKPILVFRPWTIRLAKAERKDALPSSNSRLNWQSDIVTNGDPLNVPIPARSQWRTYVEKIDFYLHRFRSSVNVRRFAQTAYANIRTLQDDFPVAVHFITDDERAAAVGFELEVDGLEIRLSIPGLRALAVNGLPPALEGAATLAYLKDSWCNDPELPEDFNSFQRAWIFQILLSGILAEANATNRPLEAAVDDLFSDGGLDRIFHLTMDEMFGAVPPEPEDEEEGDDPDVDAPNGDGDAPRSAQSSGTSQAANPPSRLQQALAAQLVRPIVRDRLEALLQEIRHADPERFAAWLRQMVLETLGEAMLQACVATAPREASVDNLLVDIHDNVEEGQVSVWVTETTLGGAGVLQSFAERFSLDPNLFFTALEAALAPTDLELVDGSLRELLVLSTSDAEIVDLVARIRGTESHSERGSAWRTLSQALARRGGFDLNHAFSVSFNSRLLRSGSGPDLDRLLALLVSKWAELDARFGLSIGLREFAYICSRDAELSAAVRRFLAATLPREAASQVTVLAAVTNLLWPRADEIRQRALQSYNPYRKPRTTDPAIVRHLLLGRSVPTVDLADSEWALKLQEAFEHHGACRLASSGSDAASIREAIVRLTVTPIDIGVLQFFAVTERIERVAGRVFALMTLREQV